MSETYVEDYSFGCTEPVVNLKWWEMIALALTGGFWFW